MKNMIHYVFVFLLVFVFCIPIVAQAEQRAIDCFECDADGEECQEQTMVLGSQADVSAFQTLLAEKNWNNDEITALLEALSAHYFEQNVMLAVYDKGIHSGSNQYILTDVTVAEQTATVYYATKVRPSGEVYPDARLTVMVRLVSLPREQVDGCTSFSLVYDAGYWLDSEPTGDVDGNGCVDAKDALCVLQAAVGKRRLNSWQQLDGDMDKNDRLDAVDALQILKKAVGK